MRRRTTPSIRRTEVLEAAVEAARQHGYSKFTRAQVAAASGCAEALVSYHMGTMTALRRQVMRYAIRNELFDVIAQGLAVRCPYVAKLPDHVRQRAAASLMG